MMSQLSVCHKLIVHVLSCLVSYTGFYQVTVVAKEAYQPAQFPEWAEPASWGSHRPFYFPFQSFHLTFIKVIHIILKVKLSSRILEKHQSSGLLSCPPFHSPFSPLAGSFDLPLHCSNWDHIATARFIGIIYGFPSREMKIAFLLKTSTHTNLPSLHQYLRFTLF